jgi:hypothetical protein
MTRMVLKSHTFSDGTFVPAGSIISVPTMPHQLDAANFENPNELDPSRFEHVKDSDATRRYFTSIDTEYMAFGLGQCIFGLIQSVALTYCGRQACLPGSVLRRERAQGYDGPPSPQLRRKIRIRGYPPDEPGDWPIDYAKHGGQGDVPQAPDVATLPITPDRTLSVSC